MKAHHIAAVTFAAALLACGSPQVTTQATAPLEPNRVGDPSTSEGVTTTGANTTAQPETTAHTTGSTHQGATKAETSEPVNKPPVSVKGSGALPHEGTPHPINTGDPCGAPCNGNH